MHKIIRNFTPNTLYYNRITNKLYQSIFDCFTIDLIRSASISAHQQNMYLYIPRPDKYQEVLPGIVPIPPKSQWYFDGNCFSPAFTPPMITNKLTTLSTLIQAVTKIASVFKNRPIAVELSGGLDTSIVIGILQELGLDPWLIGFYSNRYEFRTEKIVQETLCRKSKKSILISFEDFLPFKDLLQTPCHQLPSASSVFFSQGIPIAAACKNNDIQLLLTGMGIDALLCDSTNLDELHGHPIHWRSWMMDDNWFNENVYTPAGITCKSAVASDSIIRLVYMLRNGQGNDPWKKWARQTFASYIPDELVKFHYKADHNGYYLSGIWASIDEIRNLFQFTYELTGFAEFNIKSFDTLLFQIQTREDKKDKILLARISFATWLFSLHREKII